MGYLGGKGRNIDLLSAIGLRQKLVQGRRTIKRRKKLNS